jgi:HEAT repeat protein
MDENDVWCVVLPMNDEQTIAELIEALNNRDYTIQHHASEALGSKGILAIEPLIGVLAEYATWEDYEIFANKHSLAEDALIRIGEPAVERLIGILDDDRWGLRFGAIWSLKEIGDPRAIQPLIEILRIDDVNVTCEVSDAMEKFGEPAFEPMLAALTHTDRNVRGSALFLLGKTKDIRAVPHLIAALQDEDVEARQSAVFALGEIGDVRAFEPLIVALRDENPDIRWSAVVSLGNLGDKAAIPHLLTMMNDPDEDVREDARYALQKLEYQQ